MVRRGVRKILLMEELTKSDKKEIERLARKAIEKDRAQQKKVARKERNDRVKRSVVQTRTAGGRGQAQNQIYKKGDPLEKVVERAAIIAQQEEGWR